MRIIAAASAGDERVGERPSGYAPDLAFPAKQPWSAAAPLTAGKSVTVRK